MQSRPAPTYNPYVFGFGLCVVLATLLLLFAGGFTTSIGAGMAFPDWPLSNGSVNPEGWIQNQAMRAEHGHRLTGALVGLMTITLAVLIHRRESRKWLVRLAWSSVALVIVQGILGGLRVLLNSHPTWIENIDWGFVLRIVHGCVAQSYVCLLSVIVAASSKAWIAAETGDANLRTVASKETRRAGLSLAAILVVQLIVAAKMRHAGAGLAIPTFPLTPEGSLVPDSWNFAVGIHFTHRVLAVIILLATCVWLWRLHVEARGSSSWKTVAMLTASLLCIQILLGASVIWSGRHPHAATWHVIFGAAFLATVVTSCVGLHRLGLQRTSSATAAVPAHG